MRTRDATLQTVVMVCSNEKTRPRNGAGTTCCSTRDE